MFSRISLALTAAALIVLAGLVGTGTADGQSQAKPFKGSFTENLTPLPPTAECPVLFTDESDDGESTHLGRFTRTGTTCLFNLRVVEDPPFNPGGAPPYLVADFTFDETETAANGDLMFISGVGVYVQSSLDPAMFGTQSTGTVDGGTGRFAGASGEFQGTGDAANVLRFSGWISYDASNASG